MSNLPENYQPPDPHSLPTGPLDTSTTSYGFSHTMILVVEVEARLRVSSLPLAFRLRPRLFKAFPHGLYNIINT
ncbi:unnamed protein product [Rotaria sp. Silwood1]|nr:unnamed protein product [Rotaria sp. Silwood1]